MIKAMLLGIAQAMKSMLHAIRTIHANILLTDQI